MTLAIAGQVRLDQFELDVSVTADNRARSSPYSGPNGAGKSTLLRTISRPARPRRRDAHGSAPDVLDDPARGVFVEARHRRLGVVFQDHRLFPHLRIVDNVAFGARARGLAKGPARHGAQAWLDRLGLADLGRRRPRQLSGGQAQRVALARALACEPAALLLDEPLGALDVQTRAEVQGELREHLAAFAGPTIIVTHDPIEALLLATRIVVLERGRVAQAGSPAEITARPLTPYVAQLVGMNLYVGRATADLVALDDGGTFVAADAPAGRVLAALRPSAITVHTEAPLHSSARNVWTARVSVAHAPRRPGAGDGERHSGRNGRRHRGSGRRTGARPGTGRLAVGQGDRRHRLPRTVTSGRLDGCPPP